MNINKNNNILISGGAGFIGSNLASFFLKKGFKVTILDNLATGHIENIKDLIPNPNFKFFEGDINNFQLLKRIIKEENIQIISHQAALGSVPKSILDPFNTNLNNITGTLTTLWAAKENKIKKVVCAISSSVYGESQELPKKENMPYQPRSPYAISKVATDLYAKVFNDLYKLPTVGLRYFNVYGPKQDPDGDYAAVIPRFIKAALSNENITIFGDGMQTRDFTFIDDVLEANYLSFSHDKANGKSFNIAYGKSITILDLAKKIIKLCNSKSKIIFKEIRVGDVKDSLASLTLSKKILNYIPKWSLDEGLEKTIKYYQNDKII